MRVFTRPGGPTCAAAAACCGLSPAGPPSAFPYPRGPWGSGGCREMQQGPGHACAWGTATLCAPGEPKERTKKGQVWMPACTCAHVCARMYGSQYKHTRVCMDLQLAVHAHVYAWT